MLPELPPLEIRPATPADVAGIAAVHVAAWRETYRGLLPDSILDGLSVAARAEQWRRAFDRDPPLPSIFVAAPTAGDLVGFAAGGPHGSAAVTQEAAVYAIYVLGRAQRRGVGRRLMRALAAALQERAFSSLRLWVLESNETARRFYERLGGRVGDRRLEMMEGHELAEVAYLWDSLRGIGTQEAYAVKPGGNNE